MNARNDALQSVKPMAEYRKLPYDVLPSSQPYAKLYKIHWASKTGIKMVHDDVKGTKTKYIMDNVMLVTMVMVL
jgi:hypothetical protein